MKKPSDALKTKTSFRPHVSLVFSNFQGAVDILYFSLFGYNSFLFVDPSTLRYHSHPYSLIPALFKASSLGFFSKTSSDTTKATLRQALDACRQPTVCFPEGGKTNGTAILAFAELGSPDVKTSSSETKKLASNELDASKFSICSLKYSQGKPSNPHAPKSSKLLADLYSAPQTTTADLFSHFANMAFFSPPLLGQGVESTWIYGPALAANWPESVSSTEAADNGGLKTQGKCLRGWIACLQVPELEQVEEISAEDLAEFGQKWKEAVKGASASSGSSGGGGRKSTSRSITPMKGRKSK